MVDLHRSQTLDSSCLKRVGRVGEHFSLPIQTAGTSGPIMVCRPGLDGPRGSPVLHRVGGEKRRKEVLPNPAGATVDSRNLGWARALVLSLAGSFDDIKESPLLVSL